MVLARMLIDNGASLQQAITNQYNKGINLNWKSILNSIPNAHEILNETYSDQSNLTIAEQTMRQALYPTHYNQFAETYHTIKQSGFILGSVDISPAVYVPRLVRGIQ